MVERNNRVQWIYASKDNQELQERYDVWAKDYNQDLDEGFGWKGPQEAANTFAKHVATDAKVLDAGAGTGLVGECLWAMGFRSMVAMDLSEGMLDVARSKNVYSDFHQMVMGETLDYPTDSFDAVVSVGVLTVGHAPASSLDELVRVTQPGGHIVFSLRPDLYETGGFKEKQSELEAQGKWKLVELSERFQPLPKGEPDVFHEVWVYQATS